MFVGYLIDTTRFLVPPHRCVKLITKITTTCSKYFTHGSFSPALESLFSKCMLMDIMMYVCINIDL